MDRVKREDVEKTIDPQYNHSTSRNTAQVRVDDLAAHQTLLLLEIRDLLSEAAKPVEVAPTKPRRSQIRAHRTTWICKEEGKATFMCVDCRRLVEVSQDQMRGFKGPLITVRCHRCHRAFSLDSRQLEGEFGRMMRAHFPEKDES